ncbi:MAG: hypothetical protein WDN04_20090 [Rhodospirillales bacterium]
MSRVADRRPCDERQQSRTLLLQKGKGAMSFTNSHAVIGGRLRIHRLTFLLASVAPFSAHAQQAQTPHRPPRRPRPAPARTASSRSL